MLTSSAKAKGRALQNRVARDFARATGLTYGRPDDDAADLRGRQMGTAGPDLVRRWDSQVLEAVPFYVECRARESWSLGPRLLDGAASPLGVWYMQTAEKALREPRGEINIPLLVAHRNHYPVVAAIWDSAFPWEGSGRPEFGRLVLPVTKDKMTHLVAVLRWQDFLAWWYRKQRKWK